MSSWKITEDETNEDFKKLFEDDEGEDFELEYEAEECYGEAELDPGAELDPEAEPYIVWNEPEPAMVPLGTISSVFDDEFRPLPMTSSSSSSPRASTSAAFGSDSPRDLEPFDDLPIVLQEEAVEIELIDFVVAEQPQQQCRAGRGSPAARGSPARRRVAARRGGAACRRGAAQHGRGRGRVSQGAHSQVPIGDPQWARGEKLVEVFVNDDDVPEVITNVENARQAARERLVSKDSRVREENVEEVGDDEFQSFFNAEGTSNHFEWSPMGNYKGKREKFLLKKTGAVVAPDGAYEAFRQYWDDDIMNHIVTETNRYAAGLAKSSAAFAQSWYDTNIHELFILFAFWMMLGIIRMPSIKSCFSTNPIMQTNIFRKMFTRIRYENLCRAFHLVDNNSRPTDTTDPIFALGPIVDHLNYKFQDSYIPSQNICIDESLTLWKGNLPFRQYIKTKTAQYGVKTFELCESSTGYLWSFFVYLGAGTAYDTGLPCTVQKSTTTVLQLIRPLLDKGYTLFMDNWFNSPLLARLLKSRKTDCVGTLRANRTNVPSLMSQCELKEGQFVARHSGDVVVLAFQDKKRKIVTISTYHGNAQGPMAPKPYRPTLYKPQVILDYNMNMGGVDRKDQMLEPYLVERRRGAKWNVKFFKRLLNCSVLNALVLLQSSKDTPKLHIVFRLELVHQIMRYHSEDVPRIARPLEIRAHNRTADPFSFARHFPRKTDQHTTDGVRFKLRRCTYCTSYHKRRRCTAYVCSACEVPLCVDSCFEAYHT